MDKEFQPVRVSDDTGYLSEEIPPCGLVGRRRELWLLLVYCFQRAPKEELSLPGAAAFIEAIGDVIAQMFGVTQGEDATNGGRSSLLRGKMGGEEERK